MVQPREAEARTAANRRAKNTGRTRIDELENQVAFLRQALGALGPVLEGLHPNRESGLIGYSIPSHSLPNRTDAPSPEMGKTPARHDRARRVREHIRQRKIRGDIFPADFFADPVWDMMLDLYAAHHEAQQVSVSSLCIAAAVPPTTALRWIKTLTADGWLIRTRDDHDGRRVYIDLSDEIRGKLDVYFDAIEP